MKETALLRQLRRLCHGSQEAVQNGSGLNELDRYLHVERPIENTIKESLNKIRDLNGGMILLVGSAGDGKSHMISTLKAVYGDFNFLNDATEGCSPSMTAVETLKYAMEEFSDDKIANTKEKLFIAINYGKLLDFIEDSYIKENYIELTSCVEEMKPITESVSKKIIIISLSHLQSFELNIDSTDKPVDSYFMNSVLEKIVNKSDDNKFYQAYLEDKQKQGLFSFDTIDPIQLNFEILSEKAVRDSIVQMIIEAIIRYDLIVTPRDFLDFIYSIIVFPRWKEFNESKEFFKAVLPSLLYNSSENKIQKALALLDPLKISSYEHDRELSFLFSLQEYNDNLITKGDFALNSDLSTSLKTELEKFIANNNKYKVELSGLILRLQHIFCYHSESKAYVKFLKCLQGYYKEDSMAYEEMDELVKNVIPRHYGSYYSDSDLIPLNIQGRKYKIFARLSMPTADFMPSFDSSQPYIFDKNIKLFYDFKLEDPIELVMDFHLYEHLHELNEGKLATSYEGERNLNFSNFVRVISGFSDAAQEVIIIDNENNRTRLSFKYKKLQMN